MTFVSPLLVDTPPSAAFGTPIVAEPVANLRAELNAIVLDTAASLPEPLRAEAEAIVRGYGGGDFLSLFYVPMWSFLHWLDVDRDAKVAQAQALFLHLWDDHLCDGQLPLDLLRLQLRSAAWNRLERATRGNRIAREAIDAYLVANHESRDVHDLDSYCARSRRELALMTFVPRIAGGDVLGDIVDAFAIAWRLIDDVEDAHADALAGKQTALAFATPAQLVERADVELAGAASRAHANGWHELGRELTQSRPRMLTHPASPR